MFPGNSNPSNFKPGRARRGDASRGDRRSRGADRWAATSERPVRGLGGPGSPARHPGHPGGGGCGGRHGGGAGEPGGPGSSGGPGRGGRMFEQGAIKLLALGLLAALKERPQGVRQQAAARGAPEILRAMDNLKATLRVRFAKDGFDAETARRVAALIDEAAVGIARL